MVFDSNFQHCKNLGGYHTAAFATLRTGESEGVTAAVAMSIGSGREMNEDKAGVTETMMARVVAVSAGAVAKAVTTELERWQKR